jgi:glycerol kinase
MTAVRPTSNDGIWIAYLGEKWVSAGAAVPLTSSGFRVVGNYENFPVFARRDTSEQVVYVPTRDGLVAPYRLKQ